MITNEIKARIFAQYLGQPIGLTTVSKESLKYFKTTPSTINLIFEQNQDFKDVWLILKPLSAITDEDANKIVQLSGGFTYRIESQHFDVWMKAHSIYLKECIAITQYLQSKGYALPYMEYSVEDLVKAGIYKLEE
ncbi:MAG: hypothetical protein V4547_18370 [Bacteroidota bacterium]